MLALALAALLLAPAASAQEPPLPGGLPDIEACLAASQQNGGSCIGTLANACQEEPGGSTTPGIASCLAQEGDLWDRLLNRNYGELAERSGGGEAADALRDAQRKWIAFRDAECGRRLLGEGTIRQVDFAACRMRLTAERALALAPDER